MFNFILRSLRLKILITTTWILFLIVVIWQYFDLKAYQETIQKTLFKETSNLLTVIKRDTWDYMETARQYQIGVIFKEYRQIERIKVAYLLDAQGKVAYASHPENLSPYGFEEQIKEISLTGKDYHRFKPEGVSPFLAFLGKEEPYFSSLTPLENKPSCQRCHSSGKTVGYLGLELDARREAEVFTSRLKRILILSAPFYLFAIINIFLFLYINVFHPLEIVRQGMLKVKEGQLGLKVKTKSIDEIGQIAHTFNLMSENLKILTEELVKKEKMAVLGQMAAGVAHEVRNLLLGIKTSTYYLRRKLESHPELTRTVGDIDTGVRRAERTVTNVLQYTQPGELSREAVNINQIIEEILSSAEKERLFTRVEIKKNLGLSLPLLTLDSERLRQSIYNLVLNAAQAMPKGGQLSISTRIVANQIADKSKFVEIRIEDTGEGITEENLKNVFNPFFTTKAKGIGLGLTIVKENIEKHQGKIKVESTVGKGTTFIIQLPVG